MNNLNLRVVKGHAYHRGECNYCCHGERVTLVPHGDAPRIREAIARIISNDTIHGAPEAAADRVMRDVLNIGDNDGS